MGTFSDLVVVSPASWVARDFASAGIINVVPSLGLDLPGLDPGTTAWWCPGSYPARAAATGVTLPLLSAGPSWLSALPHRWRGRHVKTMRLSEVPLRFTGGFAKLPEIKVGSFPATVYAGAGDLLRAARAARLPDRSWLQVSEPVTYLREYRCFVADRQVTAVSPYLLDGVTWDGLDPDADPFGRLAAHRFVTAVLGDDEVDVPPGFTIDVGIDDTGAWSVIEANASWSSNPYHCDIPGVIASLLAGHDPQGLHRRWQWRIDPYHQRFARPLPRA